MHAMGQEGEEGGAAGAGPGPRRQGAPAQARHHPRHRGRHAVLCVVASLASGLALGQHISFVVVGKIGWVWSLFLPGRLGPRHYISILLSKVKSVGSGRIFYRADWDPDATFLLLSKVKSVGSRRFSTGLGPRHHIFVFCRGCFQPDWTRTVRQPTKLWRTVPSPRHWSVEVPS